MLPLWIGLGGALGAMSRAAVIKLYGALTDKHPWVSILIINGIGSFLISFFVYSGSAINNDLRQTVSTGFCGGFTTFSTFVAQTYKASEIDLFTGLLGFILNHVIGFGMCYAGYRAGSKLSSHYYYQ